MSKTNFEIKLWNEVQIALNQGNEQGGLYLLFETLHRELWTLKNYNNCNRFLILISSAKLSSDVIVHVLNVLSPKKEELKFWNEFVAISKKRLEETQGEEIAKQLMSVIL